MKLSEIGETIQNSLPFEISRDTLRVVIERLTNDEDAELPDYANAAIIIALPEAITSHIPARISA